MLSINRYQARKDDAASGWRNQNPTSIGFAITCTGYTNLVCSASRGAHEGKRHLLVCEIASSEVRASIRRMADAMKSTGRPGSQERSWSRRKLKCPVAAYRFTDLRGRPPFAPLTRAAAALAGDVA